MKKTILLFISAAFIFLKASGAECFETDDISIHGFLSQGYLKTDHNNYLADTEDGTFQFNEFGINFTAPILDDFRVGMQFFGRDLGPEGNDEVVVDWAYGDYRWRDWLGIRFGKMKLAYGLYNEIREMDMLRTSVMLPQSVYTELWRDALSSIKGLGFYGNSPSSLMGSFSYEYQIGVLAFKNDGGFSKAFEDALSYLNIDVKDIDHDYAYTYALTWETPFDGLRFRLSGHDIYGLRINADASGFIPYDLNRDGIITPGEGLPVKSIDYRTVKQKAWIISAEYAYRDLVIAGEYLEGDFQGRMNIGYGFALRPSLPVKGWYLAISYRCNPVLSLGLSYSDLYPNTNDEDGDLQVANGRTDFEAWLKTWTFSSRFDINKSWVVKFETSYNDGWGAYDSMGNKADDLERYWWLFAAKATLSF